MHMRSGMTLVGLAVAAVLASGCDIEAQSRSADGSFDRTVKVNGPVDLDILSRSGRIDIRVGDGDAVRIVGRIRAYGSFSAFSGGYTPEEQAKSLESSPPIEQSGNAISVGDIRDLVLRQQRQHQLRGDGASRYPAAHVEPVRGSDDRPDSGAGRRIKPIGEHSGRARRGRRRDRDAIGRGRRAAAVGWRRTPRRRDALRRHRQRRRRPRSTADAPAGTFAAPSVAAAGAFEVRTSRSVRIR